MAISEIKRRFEVQNLSAQIHREMSGPLERQCNCLRSINNNSAVVDLFKNPGSDHAYFAGLQTCGSVFSCPICSTKITEVRKNEVEELLDKTKDYYHYLITLTVPHYIHESCSDIRLRFMAARRRLKNWASVKNHPEFKPYSTFLKHYRYDGSITTIEVTYGNNGWHIHSHELIITKKPIQDLKHFRNVVYSNWTKAVLYSGFEINKPQAFFKRSVQIDALQGDHLQRMKAYLTKVVVFDVSPSTWGMASELTKGSIKKADNKNLTPFGMLHKINDEKDPTKKAKLYGKYKRLFWEYCQTFKGSQMIRFSKGLKKRHGMTETLDQDLVKAKPLVQLLTELINAETQEKKDKLEKLIGTMYGHFERPEWLEIKKLRLRGFIIENSNLTWNELQLKLEHEIKRRKGKKNGKTQNKTLPKNAGRVPGVLRSGGNDKGWHTLYQVPI